MVSIDGGLAGVVIDNVFKRLPLSDVVQCRLVCKDWRDILDIDKIEQNLCCLVVSHGEIWLKPENIHKHVCPSKESSIWCSTVDFPEVQKEHRLMASAHGILCFLCGSGLVVYNPATKEQRILPHMKRITGIDAVGMHFNRAQNCYTILATGKGWQIGNSNRGEGTRKALKDPYYYAAVEVFESRRGTWEHHCEFHTDSCVKKGRIAWWEGQFHWIVNPAGKGAMELVAYDMQGKKWDKCQTENITCFGHIGVPDMWVWKDSLFCKELWGTRTFAMEAGKKVWKQVKVTGVKSMLIAAHQEEGRHRKLCVCIYDPYSNGPEENHLLSSRRYLVHKELQLQPSHRFPYTPCLSAQV